MSKVKEPESYIRLLPDTIIDKIAAGEVIQRPASVVKELLDNAIDAGADHIQLVIEQSGRTLIQVTDNGCGMSEVDLERCFTRHATSKIQGIDDLYAIRTMGFRGEAMSSISAISQVDAKSKLHNQDAGWTIRLHGGEIQQKSPVATTNGTQVTVRNLFFNVPARRQFLKTDATEFRHILKTVQHAAISHPKIAFTFVSDADTVYQLPSQSLEDRIVGMFGKRYKASLIPFTEQTSYVTVHGVAGDPKLSKKSRGEQFLFVNGRPFQHRYLMHVLLSLYDNWTHANEYPFFILFIEIEPAKIDINVHPAKSEIKFEDERSVIQLSLSVMKRALNEHLHVPIIPSGSILEGAGFNSEQNQAIVDEQYPFGTKAKGLNFLNAAKSTTKIDTHGGEIARQLYANEPWEQNSQTTLVEGDEDRFT
ncbi:MAG: DNA mismatch repair endonuclease MutL, partial [Balneolaceae bacterium]